MTTKNEIWANLRNLWLDVPEDDPYVAGLEDALKTLTGIDVNIDPPKHGDALEPGQRNPYDASLGLFVAKCLCGEIFHGGDAWEADCNMLDHVEVLARLASRPEREARVDAISQSETKLTASPDAATLESKPTKEV